MRSSLFIPGDSERKLARGLESGADALLLDLEDSVAASRRPAARELMRSYLGSAQRPKTLAAWVRINPLATEMALEDLAAVMPGRPDGILLPKGGPEELRRLDHYLAAFEAASGAPVGSTRIMVIATETPAAFFALGQFAGVTPRLAGLTWGAEDLAAVLGSGANRRPDGVYDDVFRLARSCCVLAAAHAGVEAIDTVYTDFRNDAGLRAECAEARRAGYTGKMAIHPAQIGPINEAFTPSAEERAWAEKVVAGFAANPDAGTIGIDGKMVDKPHLTLALRTLSRLRERAG